VYKRCIKSSGIHQFEKAASCNKPKKNLKMSHDCSSNACKHQFAVSPAQTNFTHYQGLNGDLFKVNEDGSLTKEPKNSQVESLKIEESPRSPSPYPLLIDSQRPSTPVEIPASTSEENDEENNEENSEMDATGNEEGDGEKNEEGKSSENESDGDEKKEKDLEDIQMRYDDFHQHLNNIVSEYFKEQNEK